jgi:hypothetical protein
MSSTQSLAPVIFPDEGASLAGKDPLPSSSRISLMDLLELDVPHTGGFFSLISRSPVLSMDVSTEIQRRVNGELRTKIIQASRFRAENQEPQFDTGCVFSDDGVTAGMPPKCAASGKSGNGSKIHTDSRLWIAHTGSGAYPA